MNFLGSRDKNKRSARIVAKLPLCCFGLLAVFLSPQKNKERKVLLVYPPADEGKMKLKLTTLLRIFIGVTIPTDQIPINC